MDVLWGPPAAFAVAGGVGVELAEGLAVRSDAARAARREDGRLAGDAEHAEVASRQPGGGVNRLTGHLGRGGERGGGGRSVGRARTVGQEGPVRAEVGGRYAGTGNGVAGAVRGASGVDGRTRAARDAPATTGRNRA